MVQIRLIAILLFSGSIFCFAQKDERKLFIYLTLNDSIEFKNVDSVKIKGFACFKLHIDTIKTSEIKKIDQNFFEYQNTHFRYVQLYDLKDTLRIKDPFLRFYEIAFSVAVEPRFRKFTGNCIENGAKDFLYIYNRNVKLSESSKKFYFEAGVYNNVGEKIELNNIRCTLK